MRFAGWLMAGMLLAGCATNPREIPDVAGLLNDGAFSAPTERIATGDLFALSPEMRAYLQSPAFRQHIERRGRDHGLVAALYTKGDLQLEYDDTVTRNAAETFRTRSGNCLSLVIMTAAIARELGLDVVYQDVLVEQSWARQGTVYMASTHVNLALMRPTTVTTTRFGYRDALVIDFVPSDDAVRLRARPLDETTLTAMYMNNRAAEALAAGRTSDAYWWAREAVLTAPSLDIALNTLGAVYQRNGDMALAERVYKEVLRLKPDSLPAMQNLVRVFGALEKPAEASELARRVARLDPYPPLYFFTRGVEAARRGEFTEARAQLRKELARNPDHHESHYWLAVASLRLGDPAAAQKELQLALGTSTSSASRTAYAAKLDHLRTLAARSRAGEPARQ